MPAFFVLTIFGIIFDDFVSLMILKIRTMRKTKLTLSFLVMAFVSLFTGVKAQELDMNFPIDPLYRRVFNPDSLKGFDESAARANAISEGYYGSEFIVRMYNLKKEYINNKYGLVKPQTRTLTDYLIATRPAAAPGCDNEDFEASTPGQITSSNQIAGWTITKGGHAVLSRRYSQPGELL
jgi:hypothetical protein